MKTNPQSPTVVVEPSAAAATVAPDRTPPQRTLSRREAAQRGDLLYIGTDCPRHHGGERYVRTNDCKICSQERSKKSKHNFCSQLGEVRPANAGAESVAGVTRPPASVQ